MKKTKIISSLMLLISALLWGMSYGVQSSLSNVLGTYSIIFIKGFSGYLLLAYCLLFKRRFDKKTVLSGMLIGTCNGIGLLLQQQGLSMSSVSKTSFISGLYIIIVPIIQLFTNIRPKKQFWLAVTIACIGMYFLCINGEYGVNIGDILTFASTFFFALQIILIAKYTKTSDFVTFCATQQASTASIAGLLMIIFEKPQLSSLSGLMLPILYVIFLSGMTAQLLQNRFQRDVDPSLASLIMSLESVFGALSGWLLLNQTLTGRELFGCILIFASIIIAE